MNSKKIIGLVLLVGIVGLMVMLLSQEGEKTKVTSKFEESQKKKVATPIPDNQKSEEEQVLEDLKKQAGVNLNQEVSKLYVTRCASCHGKVGEGTRVGPSISGKSMDYILAKLDDYKNDRVPNSLMKGLLNNITNEEVKTLANEISNFK